MNKKLVGIVGGIPAIIGIGFYLYELKSRYLPSDFNLRMEQEREKSYGGGDVLSDVRPVIEPDYLTGANHQNKIPDVVVEVYAEIDGKKRDIGRIPAWENGVYVFPNIASLLYRGGMITSDRKHPDDPNPPQTHVPQEMRDASIDLVCTVDPENKINESSELDNQMRLRLTSEDLENAALRLYRLRFF